MSDPPRQACCQARGRTTGAEDEFADEALTGPTAANTNVVLKITVQRVANTELRKLKPL